MDQDRQWSELIRVKQKRVDDTSLPEGQRQRCAEQLIKIKFEKDDIQAELMQLANPFISIPLKSLLCQALK
jgi:hypothetical protein